jgi:hypothetical protein
MKNIQRITGACALLMIAFVLLAGCTFLQPGTTPAQSTTPGTTPSAVPVQTPEREVSQTCPEFGGNVCLTDEICSGSLVKTTDSSRCCAGTCSLASAQGLTPGADQTTAGVSSIVTVTPGTTSMNPDTTPISLLYAPTQATNTGVNPTSTAAPQVQQTAEITVAKSCLDFGGNICLADELCDGSLVQTTDSSRCCAGSCKISASYVVVPTTAAPTSVPVVPKTCAAFGGLICQATETCTGALVQSTDSSVCCAGTCAPK